MVFGIVKTVVYASVPVFFLRGVATTSPTARYYAHLGLYLGALCACATWGVVVGALLAIAGRRYDVNFVVARSFYLVVSKLLDIQVEVEGEEHLQTRPVVLMGNHQSMLDILMLGKIVPLGSSIMAKKELQMTPLGPFMQIAGTIFVDRGRNPQRAQESLKAAGDAMKSRGTSLWIFPEGTRTNEPEITMKPFKKGGFHLAVQSGVPILPVVVENYWWIYHQNVFGSGTIKVRVLPPIETQGLTVADIPNLVTQTRETMLSALREISTHPPQGQSSDVPTTSANVKEVVSPPEKAQASAETVESRSADAPPSTSTSSSSLGLVNVAPIMKKSESEGTGTETEDEEGWGLVGRPGSGPASG